MLCVYERRASAESNWFISWFDWSSSFIELNRFRMRCSQDEEHENAFIIPYELFFSVAAKAMPLSRLSHPQNGKQRNNWDKYRIEIEMKLLVRLVVLRRVAYWPEMHRKSLILSRIRAQSSITQIIDLITISDSFLFLRNTSHRSALQFSISLRQSQKLISNATLNERRVSAKRSNEMHETKIWWKSRESTKTTKTNIDNENGSEDEENTHTIDDSHKHPSWMIQLCTVLRPPVAMNFRVASMFYIESAIG